MAGAADGEGELRRENSLRDSEGGQTQRTDLWQQTLQVGSEMCQVVRFALCYSPELLPSAPLALGAGQSLVSTMCFSPCRTW